MSHDNLYLMVLLLVNAGIATSAVQPELVTIDRAAQTLFAMLVGYGFGTAAWWGVLLFW